MLLQFSSSDSTTQHFWIWHDLDDWESSHTYWMLGNQSCLKECCLSVWKGKQTALPCVKYVRVIYPPIHTNLLPLCTLWLYNNVSISSFAPNENISYCISYGCQRALSLERICSFGASAELVLLLFLGGHSWHINRPIITLKKIVVRIVICIS